MKAINNQTLIAEADERLEEIREQATARFLDRIDFDVTENMSNAELKEYRECYKIVYGDCPTCGQLDTECDCVDV